MKETDNKSHSESHYQPKYYEKNSNEPLFTLEPDSSQAGLNSGRNSITRHASKIIVPPNIPLTELLEIEQLNQSEDTISQVSNGFKRTATSQTVSG